MALTLVILIIGLTLAAVVTIFIYGHLGIMPPHGWFWVDYVFWGIILISILPLTIETLGYALRRLRKQLEEFCRSHSVICH